MAQGISDELTKSYRFPNMAHLHLKVRTSPARAKWRKLLRSILASPVASDQNVNAGVANFESGKDHFYKNHWAFVENFWEPKFHTKLLEHWPGDRYFNPIRQIMKSYDTGFNWGRGKPDPELLAGFPAYKAAYDYLHSEDFCQRVMDVAGDKVERVCSSMLMTRAYWGTSIIPHIDSFDLPHAMNLVIFINGTGGVGGGGLGIWADNEFKRPIFIPDNLKNSCIFYDMSERFYHGFQPMRFGSFRWTINAIYRKP